MIESQWTKHELNDVEVSPKELASVKFSNVEINELGQILTPTQVSPCHSEMELKNIVTFVLGCPLPTRYKPILLIALKMCKIGANEKKKGKKEFWKKDRIHRQIIGHDFVLC